MNKFQKINSTDKPKKDLSVIILAAGKGKRMKSDLPKVLTKTIDKPLILHVLESIEPLSPKLLAIVTGHGAQQVEDSVLKEISSGELNFVTPKFPHQNEQLGTGHAASMALPLLEDFNGVTLIVCGDTPLLQSSTLNNLLEIHQERGATVTILTAVVTKPASYGRIIRDSSGDYVTKITESRDCSPDERLINEINCGVYAVESEFLKNALTNLENDNAQGEYYLTDIIERAVLAGHKVCGVGTYDPDEWLGVNTYGDLAKVNEVILRQRSEHFMNNGVEILNPASVIIGKDAVIEGGVFIGPNSQILGKSVIRKGSYIEGNCYLKDTEIKEGAIVKFSVRSEGAVIGERASVGPFAHLRAGSSLGTSVKIGNFVETKNANIKANSSAGHLSYLGDCVIGERVNIGAGTITCNYDGFAKHQTVIEDECFIGSDSCLIAPLKIEHGSTVGAGSVISKDIPKKSLALTRAQLVIKDNYERKGRKV